MHVPEKLDVRAEGFLDTDDVSKFEIGVVDEASRGIDHCWLQDVERLDEIIGRYLPVAQSAEQDFDRALRAAYLVLDLIETQSTLLESYIRGTP
jgi:hypothetical protein